MATSWRKDNEDRAWPVREESNIPDSAFVDASFSLSGSGDVSLTSLSRGTGGKINLGFSSPDGELIGEWTPGTQEVVVKIDEHPKGVVVTGSGFEQWSNSILSVPSVDLEVPIQFEWSCILVAGGGFGGFRVSGDLISGDIILKEDSGIYFDHIGEDTGHGIKNPELRIHALGHRSHLTSPEPLGHPNFNPEDYPYLHCPDENGIMSIKLSDTGLADVVLIPDVEGGVFIHPSPEIGRPSGGSQVRQVLKVRAGNGTLIFSIL